MTQRIVCTVASVSALLSCSRQAEENKRPEKPNIIFILADDLGYGDLGCYGQKSIKTPVLDKLADEGIRFTRHYSGSTVSAPSRCCLMTGKHTGHSKIRGNADVPLTERDTTVAELLKSAGYNTALIGKWGLGDNGTTGAPNRKGFDYFYGYLDQVLAHNSYPEYLWRDTAKVMLQNKVVVATEGYAKGKGGIATEKREFSNALFTSEALQYIDKNTEKPFFLYLAYTIPHANNEAPAFDSVGIEVPSLGAYSNKPWPEVEKAKAAAISYLDSDIGKIIAMLKQKGLDKNTIVIFSSDNGPHQEGGVVTEFFNSNGPLQGIKRDLTEGGIRVPLIAWCPSLIKDHQVTDHVSAFWDFLPTACELAGIKSPSSTDGISYAPVLFGNEQKTHDYLYWEFHEQGGKQAILVNNRKGIRMNADLNKAMPVLVYDILNDSSEQNCLTSQFPDICRTFDSLINRSHTLSEDFPFAFEKVNLK